MQILNDNQQEYKIKMMPSLSTGKNLFSKANERSLIKFLREINQDFLDISDFPISQSSSETVDQLSKVLQGDR